MNFNAFEHNMDIFLFVFFFFKSSNNYALWRCEFRNVRYWIWENHCDDRCKLLSCKSKGAVIHGEYPLRTSYDAIMLHINSCTSWDECAADKQIFCITCKATAAASSTSWIRRQKNSPNAWITSVADAAAAVVCNSNLYSLCWECVIRLDSCERSNGAFSLFAIKLWRVGTHNFRHHHFAIFHCIYNVALFYVCQSIPTYAQSTLYVHRAPCLYEAIILTHTHIRYIRTIRTTEHNAIGT